MEEVEISELCYDENIVINAKDEKVPNRILKIYTEALEKLNMQINQQKTKTVIIGRDKQDHRVHLGTRRLQ